MNYVTLFHARVSRGEGSKDKIEQSLSLETAA